MAEIKIEKKKPVWPWILGAVIILALLYFLVFEKENDEFIVNDDIETIIDDNTSDNDMLSDNAAAKIADYNSYIADTSKMGIDHEYSHGALMKLIETTKAVSNNFDVDINSDLEKARAHANTITEDPLKAEHADKIRNAGSIIVKAMEQIQMKKFPDMKDNVADLDNAVKAINPETQTLNQKDEVNSFFEKAGNVLNNMKNE